MKKNQILIIIGIIISVIGGILIMTSITDFSSPRDDAVWTGEFGPVGGEEKAYLETGNYEIWAEEAWETPKVSIRDRDGRYVFNNTPGGSSETLTVMDVEYQKVGAFSIIKSDTYTVQCTEGIIHITPPMETLEMLGKSCVGIVVLLVGIMIIIIGFIMSIKKSKPMAPAPVQSPPPATDASPPSQYEPPPPDVYEPPPPDLPPDFQQNRPPPPSQ